MKGNVRPSLIYCLIFFLLFTGYFAFQGISATNIIKSGSGPSESQSPYCLSFDGNSYVYCGQSQIFKQQSFTIEAWIKPEYNIYAGSDSLYGHQYGTIISFNRYGDYLSTGGWWLEFDYSNGQLFFGWRYNGADMNFMARAYPFNKAVWHNDTWYHIAVTFDPTLPSNMLKFYINGSLDSEFSDSSTIRYTTSQPLQIGSGGAGNYYNYSGLIDEVRIWNYSLTQSEIQSTMSRTLSSDETLDPNLLGYWPFDEGTGSITKDYSSYGNDGILPVSPATPQWFSPGCPISYGLNLTTITFIQTGLPQGSEWSVNLNGVTKSSTNSNLTFNMLEGNYFYTIGNVTDFKATPSSGSVTVKGTNMNITISFAKGWILPSSPMNLSAGGTLKAIILQWVPPNNNGAPPSFNGSGIESYHIYRGTSSGSEKYYDTVNGTTYTDNSVSAGIIYFYEVTAINLAGESGFSNEASAQPVFVTVPSEVQNLTATPVGNSIQISWNPPASNGGSAITEYVVLRGPSSSQLNVQATVQANVTSYTDRTNLVAGQTFYYSVEAVNSQGTGSPSGAVPVVAPPTPANNQTPWYLDPSNPNFLIVPSTIILVIVGIITLYAIVHYSKPKKETNEKVKKPGP